MSHKLRTPFNQVCHKFQHRDVSCEYSIHLQSAAFSPHWLVSGVNTGESLTWNESPATKVPPNVAKTQGA
ncbi:hypothetical protein EYF80_055511 [Liparis tanakae]|uniref:Uncharacterized protein n=1 Tax=Liparis tanakae TaxID=230148 RepID=A0A4Z2F0C5_9TELE|nr:hypothetical protein EYF80_055511 [Liparis tanakae]